jgi:phosphoglycerate dehydrogenase-like enzyme
MKKICSITSTSFSKNKYLINEVKKIRGIDFRFNKTGNKLNKNNLINFLKNSDYAIVGLEKINSDILKYCPKLKIISKYGVGMDNIDFKSANAHKVKIVHSKGTNKRSVAELTLALSISLFRNITSNSEDLKNGIWKINIGSEISGKTIGIIGLGNVGTDLVRLLKPFKCKILVNDIINIKKKCKKLKLKFSTKKEIFKVADLITIHTPLTNLTKNLVNKSHLKLMKKSSFIINTSRGGIVNEQDLYNYLQNKKIMGAALDVYQNEPCYKKKLIRLKNIICTSHIGGSTEEAIKNMGLAAIKNLKNALN